MVAPRTSYLGRSRGSGSSGRTRTVLEVAIAMNSQLPKTICFIGGVAATSVYVIHGWPSRSPNLSSLPSTKSLGDAVLPSAARRRNQRGLSSLVSRGLGSRMPRTYQHYVGSRDSGTPSTVQRRGSTLLGLRCEEEVVVVVPGGGRKARIEG